MTEPGDEIRGSSFVVRNVADGYVHVIWDDGVNVSEDDAISVVQAVREFANNRTVPLLIDMRNMRSIEKAARNRFGNADLVECAALLVDTALSRIIGNFYIGLARKRFPARLFTEKDAAVEWLLGNCD